MKHEHCKQTVVPLHHFLFRMLRYAFAAFVLVVFSMGIGSIGYYHFAQLNWLDSFHMSCLILTGMGPVAEMTSTGGKLFSSFYALYSGVAFISVSAVFFTPNVHCVLHILQLDTNEDEKSLNEVGLTPFRCMNSMVLMTFVTTYSLFMWQICNFSF